MRVADLPLASSYPGRTLVRVAQNYAEAVLHNALVRMPYLRP